MTTSTPVIPPVVGAPDGPTAVRSAQRIVEGVEAHGVKYIFGIPGAKIDQVFDALVDGGPELIVCRHEQNAAFMAAAVGRLTGIPGVTLVTSGPGTSNLATGLLTANTEGDPVVALCGAVSRADRLKRTHQSLDAAAHLGTVTKFCGEVNDADNVPEALANAFRAATSYPRGAAALVLPSDVLATPTTVSVRQPVAVGRPGGAPAPDIFAAASLIKAARRPVLLVGARGAAPESVSAVRALIAATQLPVVETFQAAGVVSRELESQYLGRVGLFRNQPADVIVAHADLVIAVGYDSVEYDPGLWNLSGSRLILHIDWLPADIDRHYQPNLELIGDIAATVAAMTSLLEDLPRNAELDQLVSQERRRLDEIDEHARCQPHGPNGLNPALVTLLLRDCLEDDATIACDIGSVYIYMARHFRVYEPRHLLFSDGQQTLGVALPWAMAATLVRPGKQVVSISGDGGFLFSAQEIETATRHGMTFTHIILRDNTYDMVGFQELLHYGRKSGVQLGDYDVRHFAAAFGAHGYRVSSEEEFVATLKRALDEEGPSIVDVPVDYSHNTELAAHLIGDVFH
jgi:acetolactate synthase-1/2/3 large subunit